MEAEALEDLEVTVVLDTIRRRWGLDFCRYGRLSITRQLRSSSQALGMERVCELVPLVVHEPERARELVHGLYVSVTRLFRDPEVFRGLVEQVLPELAIQPRPKIWHAGCASGEEVYSLAVLIEEAGFLDRARIYATDINLPALALAGRGAYPLVSLEAAESGYVAAGGQRRLRDHLVTLEQQPTHAWKGGPMGMFSRRLREKIVWSAHDLTRDAVFAELDLILCRNTLFYFENSMRCEILDRFRSSLSPRGWLTLGMSETLEDTATSGFESYLPELRIYRRRTPWANPRCQ